MLESTDDNILKDTLWSLANICDSSDEATKELLKEDPTNKCIKKIINILGGNNKTEIVVPALRFIGNVVSNYDDTVTTHVVDMGILSIVEKNLTHK